MTKVKPEVNGSNKNATMKLFGDNISYNHEIKENNIELFAIPSLPKNILKQIDYITSIDISNCNLSTIPNAISELPLINLNISHNALAQVPDSLYTSLYRITHLDISHNFIEEFPPPNCLLSLTILKVNNNKLKTMPPWIWESSIRLKELDLSNNNFDMKSYGIMFKTFFSTSRLIRLWVTDCNFSNVDAFILSRIPNLVYLNIGNKNISDNKSLNSWDIPISKLNCKNNLKHLVACNLYLSALPDDIHELRCLNSLNVSHNNLHWLPETVCLLKSLRVCDVSSNLLTYFPREFLQLSSLVELYLADNNITDLPNFTELANLRVLDMYNNCLDEINSQLIEHVSEIDIDFNFIDCDCDMFNAKKNKLRHRLGVTRSNGFKIKTNPHSENESVPESFTDEDVDEFDNDNDAKSKCSEEIWDDTNFLDDNFVPTSPIPTCARYEKLKVSANNWNDFCEIFRDAD